MANWFTGLSKNNRHRPVLISVSMANFMEGAGIVVEPIVAPMLRASGYQAATAGLLQVSPSLLAGGLAVESISSPLKMALAASMCGAEGREGWILTRTIPLGVGVALLLGFVLLIML